jgi:hypothetical protein
MAFQGLLTIVVSLTGYFLVPASPDKARFLTAEEKQHLIDLLGETSDSVDVEPFNWHGVRQAITDPAAYGYSLLFHAHSFALYSISLFAVRSSSFLTFLGLFGLALYSVFSLQLSAVSDTRIGRLS